jgi:uncharacterized protein (DUF1501 family)
MDRRNFLKNAALASGSLMIPQFLRASSFRNLQSSRVGKNVVVIQLSGGNDGLNTIVPFGNDLYYKARPRLAVPKDQVIRLDGELGFNPAMQALQPLFENGGMSIINSVGYPNPNRSHFRSMDIWQTASSSDQYLTNGWLGRYLDHQCQGCQPYHALELDEQLSLAMKGELRDGFAMQNPVRLKRTTDNPYLKKVAEHHEDHGHDQVAYLYKTMIDTQSSAEYLAGKAKMHRSSMQYPNHDFGKGLKQIAELMTANTDIRIYYISLGSFDTHAGQKGKQERLLKIYADSVAAFTKDLKQNGLFDDTLIMTFSEFGRRVAQNAGNGTDHGTANNLFLMGGKLKQPGIVNAAPNLFDLNKGDLKYQIDFRRIYSEIIGNWLDGDAQTILGQGFDPLGVV